MCDSNSCILDLHEIIELPSFKFNLMHRCSLMPSVRFTLICQFRFSKQKGHQIPEVYTGAHIVELLDKFHSTYMEEELGDCNW